MSGSKANRGVLAQAKAQPGKTITLTVLVLMMSLVWGRNLVGDDDSKSKRSATKASSTSSSAQATSRPSVKQNRDAATSGKPRPTPAAGSIENFATAIARMETWRRPLGIEKAAPLTEEYLQQRRDEAEAARQARWERTNAAREAGLAVSEEDAQQLSSLAEQSESGESGEITSEGPELLANAPEGAATGDHSPILVDSEMEVDLTLTGTLVFGDARYALFGTRRVQEGVNFGRYLLKAVRPREVDIVVDGVLTTVQITLPTLGDQ